MKWTFDRILLALGGLIFLGFGILLLVRPEVLAEIGISLESPTARADIRAIYGGLEIGVGLFLCVCALHESRVYFGLIGTAWITGFMAIGRLVGILLEGGDVDHLMWIFLGLESAWAILTLWLARRRGNAPAPI